MQERAFELSVVFFKNIFWSRLKLEQIAIFPLLFPEMLHDHALIWLQEILILDKEYIQTGKSGHTTCLSRDSLSPLSLLDVVLLQMRELLHTVVW